MLLCSWCGTVRYMCAEHRDSKGYPANRQGKAGLLRAGIGCRTVREKNSTFGAMTLRYRLQPCRGRLGCWLEDRQNVHVRNQKNRTTGNLNFDPKLRMCHHHGLQGYPLLRIVGRLLRADWYVVVDIYMCSATKLRKLSAASPTTLK